MSAHGYGRMESEERLEDSRGWMDGELVQGFVTTKSQRLRIWIDCLVRLSRRLRWSKQP